jgi:hypothetical protein
MIETDIIYLAVAFLTLVSTAVLARFMLFSKLTLDKDRYEKLIFCWTLSAVAVSLIFIAYVFELFLDDEAMHKAVELSGLIFFMATMAIIARNVTWRQGIAGLNEVDWGEVAKEVEFKSLDIKAKKSAVFDRIFDCVKDKSICIVEIKGQSMLPVYRFMVSNISTKAINSPMLGVTTPYDIREIVEKMGAKSGLWVSDSKTDEPWINDKFTIVPSSSLSEITNFVNTLGKGHAGLFFTGDFLDEIHGLVNEQQMHMFMSRLRTIAKQNDNKVALFIKRELYSEAEMALIERYADAKIEITDGKKPTVILHDLTQNKTEDMGEIELE